MKMIKIKTILLGISLVVLGGFSFAQNGLERVIVEKYYVSNAADAAGSIGALPVGSVTYRVFADMLTGYKFEALYGVGGHALNINTSTSFFNNEDRGATTPNGIGSQYLHTNSVALDSWFSTGAAANGQLGVLKSEDNGAANLISANTILQNNDASAGIPLTTQDGMIAGTPQAVNFVGLTTELNVFDGTSNVGGSFTTSNGSIASLVGSTGPTSTNRVLIGQFTTNGHFHFDLNIQIGTPTNGIQNFVAHSPVGSEISIPSLVFDSYISTTPTVTSSVTYCMGATATPLTATPMTGDTLIWYTAATGGTGSSTAPTPSTAAVGTTTYYVSQHSGISESSRAAITVTVNSLAVPPVPGTITGATNNCLYIGSSTTYSIAPVAGVASYNWTVPATGASIVSGQGTTAITVAFTSAYTTGSISVQSVNCSSSAFKTLTVTKTLPTMPGVVTGPIAVCNYVGTSTPVAYTIAAVSGAASYVWTVPTNVSIVSGQGTTGITVSYASVTGTGALGNITVSSVSAGGCSSLPKTVALTATAPATPTVLTGTAAICAYVGTSTSLTYTTTANIGATSYLWTVPTGVNVLSGQGTTSLTVNYLNAPQGSTPLGNITVADVSGCATSAAKVVSLTRLVPASPTTITGPIAICNYVGQSTPVTYSVAAVTGALSYTWTIPANVTLLSGQGTTAITVSYASVPSGAGTVGTISVTSNSGCGSSLPRTITVSKALPLEPGVIAGPTAICSYVGTSTPVTYSVATVASAASYTWTVPTGVNILSGQGTTAISVNFSGVATGAGTVGNIGVISNAPCGSSIARTTTVTKTDVLAPTVINGPLNNVCAATNYTYSTPAIATATNYIWTVPAGGSIVSGQGTDTVVVHFPAGYATGAITVAAANACSQSIAKSITVTAAAGAPVAITGPVVVCPAIGNGNSLTYTIAPVAGVSSYLWTTPTNSTIVSGQGTTSVSVSFASNFISGNLSVVSVGNCTNSAAKTLALNKLAGEPISITGATSICSQINASTPVAYSTAAVVGATSYNWTVPSGAIITSGTGTTAITVLFAANTPSGTFVKVASVDSCGTSLFRSTVALTTCMDAVSMNGASTDVTTAASAIYPNPANGVFGFDFNADADKNILVEVYNVLGAKVMAQQYGLVTGANTIKTNIGSFDNGMYFVRITDLSNNTSETKTFVKN